MALRAWGSIKANGVGLGAVSIHGDLGSVDAGTGVPGNVAVKSLSAASFGSFGLSTGAADLLSTLTGSLGALTVQTDVRDASFAIGGPLKSLTVGGSAIRTICEATREPKAR